MITIKADVMTRIRRQRKVYQTLLRAIVLNPDGEVSKRSPVQPAEARRAIVALSGATHSYLAALVEGASTSTTRQLVSMVIDGNARSDRVERALAIIFGVTHGSLFPEPRSRRPNRSQQ